MAGNQTDIYISRGHKLTIEYSESEIINMQKTAVKDAYIALSMVMKEVANGTAEGLISKNNIPSAFVEHIIQYLVRNSRLNGEGHVDDLCIICQHAHSKIIRFAGNTFSFLNRNQNGKPNISDSQLDIYRPSQILQDKLTNSAKTLLNDVSVIINTICQFTFQFQINAVKEYGILIKESQNAPLLLNNGP